MKMPNPHKQQTGTAQSVRSLTGKIALAGFLGVAGMTPSALAATGTWNKDINAAAYSWADAANWNENAAPNGNAAIADLSKVNLSLGIATINLNQTVTVGSMLIGDANASVKGGYTIAAGSGGSLVFNNTGGTGNATLTHVATSGSNNTISAPITLQSNLDITSNTGTAQLKITSLALGGNTLTASTNYGSSAAGNIEITSLTGSGTFVVKGTGVTRVTGASSNTIAIEVQSGVLGLGPASIASLGDITTSGTGTVGYNSSTLGTYAKSISGTGRLLKTATGALVLTGANTYTGTTTVSQGELRVNGSLGQTAVTVAAAANLSGKGSIGGTVAVSGTLAAGDAGVGTLQTGGLSLASTSVFDVQIGGAGATAASDSVGVTGDVNIATGATLKLTLSGIAVPANGDIFYLITNDSTEDVVGNFNYVGDLGLVTLSEGSQFSWNSQDWIITYKADAGTSSFTDGNDIAIRAIPEPSTWAFLVGGLGMLVVAQGMRKRSMAS